MTFLVPTLGAETCDLQNKDLWRFFSSHLKAAESSALWDFLTSAHSSYLGQEQVGRTLRLRHILHQSAHMDRTSLCVCETLKPEEREEKKKTKHGVSAIQKQYCVHFHHQVVLTHSNCSFQLHEQTEAQWSSHTSSHANTHSWQ